MAKLVEHWLTWFFDPATVSTPCHFYKEALHPYSSRPKKKKKKKKKKKTGSNGNGDNIDISRCHFRNVKSSYTRTGMSPTRRTCLTPLSTTCRVRTLSPMQQSKGFETWTDGLYPPWETQTRRLNCKFKSSRAPGFVRRDSLSATRLPRGYLTGVGL